MAIESVDKIQRAQRNPLNPVPYFTRSLLYPFLTVPVLDCSRSLFVGPSTSYFFIDLIHLESQSIDPRVSGPRCSDSPCSN